MGKPKNKNFKDVQGQFFDRWEVLSYAGSENRAKWLCKCSCGTVRIVSSNSLFQGSRSCGCVQREAAAETGKTLHLRRRKFPSPVKTHGLSKTPEYRAWSQMIQRCINKNIRNYEDYGGRGIKVCQEWMESFQKFYEHIGPRPSSKHSLDRKNNDGNYEPGNVRWATGRQQMNNSRHAVKFLFQGEMLSMAEIARRVPMPYATLRARLMAYKWTLERSVSEPILVGGPK